MLVSVCVYVREGICVYGKVREVESSSSLCIGYIYKYKSHSVCTYIYLYIILFILDYSFDCFGFIFRLFININIIKTAVCHGKSYPLISEEVFIYQKKIVWISIIHKTNLGESSFDCEIFEFLRQTD